MRARVLYSLWHEPREQAPVGPPWWEVALLVVFCVAAILEASLKVGVEYRFAQACGGVYLVAPLFFRLQKPFGTFLTSFAGAAAVPLAVILFDLNWRDLDSTAIILLAVYTLFRWGSGNEAGTAVLVLLGLYGLTVIRGQYQGVSDALAGAIVLIFPALLGLVVRIRARARVRERDAVRLAERELLARDLHDSVAHHVSAIALQAQGALAIASTRPEAVLGVLQVIQEEASRTLSELRALVGALRDQPAPSLRPQARIADIQALSSRTTAGLRVEVNVEGDDQAVPAALQSAVYRIAQEGITNAQRHARRATQVLVSVRVSASEVTLTVNDDGESRPTYRPEGLGYGLIGMAERAELLGGTFNAGPRPSRGWCVEVTFPLEEPSR